MNQSDAQENRLNFVGRSLLVISGVFGLVAIYTMATDALEIYKLVRDKSSYIYSLFSFERGHTLEQTHAAFLLVMALVVASLLRPNELRICGVASILAAIYLSLCATLVGESGGCKVYMLGLLNSPSAALSSLLCIGAFISELSVRVSENGEKRSE